MGQRGPAKTPTAILKLHGSNRVYDRKDTDPPPTTKERMPLRVSQKKYAKAYWKKNYQKLIDLGLMTGFCTAGFEQLCIAFHNMIYFEKQIDQTSGLTGFSHRTKQMVVHPFEAKYHRWTVAYEKKLNEFGGTPSAQGGMNIEIKSSGGTSDSERFFGKKFSG